MPTTSRRSLVLAAVAVAGLGLAWSAVVGAGTAGRSVRRRTPVVEAVQRAAPGVVNVNTTSGNTRGTGSGVIVHPAGWVVTNSHVVRGAARIVVELSKAAGPGQRLHEARLVEDDPSHDLALLRIGGRANFPYVPLARTVDVMVGETAIAIGNPYALGDTVTVGVVSAVGRTAALSSGVVIKNLLQTDASINLGNSGGALLNLDAELIGINTSKHPSAQGIAFTVPADSVQELLDRNLGAASRPPPPEPPGESDEPAEVASTPPPPVAPPAPAPARAPRGVPAVIAPAASSAPPPPAGLFLRAAAAGLVVVEVEPDSSADLAGLRAGDVVVRVDGKPAPSAADLERTVAAAPAGRTFSLTVLRDGRRVPVLLLAR